MDPLTIITLGLRYAPDIKAIWDEATSNDDAITKIKALLGGPVVSMLEWIGAQAFPKAAPAIHIIGGIVHSFDPSIAKWIQRCLNTLLTPSPNLVVDGIYGAKTKAAVEALQAKYGLKVDGLAGAVTQALINKLWNALP